MKDAISGVCPAASSASPSMHGETAPTVSLADTGTAYPPGEGDVEHLHGAGAARGHRLDVCRLPWPEGLRAIAERVHREAARLAEGLSHLGFKVRPDVFFDTITVEVGPFQGLIMKNAVDNGVNLRKVGHDRIGITVDERTRPDTLEAVWRAFGGYDLPTATHTLCRATGTADPTSAYLTHPIFHMNRAESEMTRYMRRLADRDLALDRSMIPLGSCTMKLNATAEMLPITWPEFSEMHPFVPADQALGYKEMIDDLSEKLCQITGYDAISMQPNSGAQGEYAGLLDDPRLPRSRGESYRDVCLIPASAHGTNPASAHDVWHEGRRGGHGRERQYRRRGFPRQGRTRTPESRRRMITYPSTHGVFEETVREICEITHATAARSISTAPT